ncbi:SDR family NAD(P)-dependent oxidoreductase [Asanoa iriomotensis]|uniref:Short-chain dehydrogenase n=1 Tax=Asanoa iriomotensis TaxID=234613 RepID=A0ABQ4C1T6_9ACTN|nr:SDR family oxidoreductase [Asanoa iriomotensis]GIF56727.1 short-chain dehydrogenase [Asanoa iriomotensis]
MDLQLAGKRAVVTGGSRGIGNAIAWALAREGCDIGLVARHREEVGGAARELHDAIGVRVVPLVADTSSTEAVDAMVTGAMELLGGVDVLVNCAARPAGAGTAPPVLDDITDERFHEEMNTKVMGYLRCARAVAPHMRRAGWGRIISISGLAARRTGDTIASMRNVAVVAMTRNLAEELGPSGINVTAVHPSSPFTQRSPAIIRAAAEREGISEDEATRKVLAGNALHRVIHADDIAALVTFLASPLSVAINGDVIAAGGGVGQSIYY